MQPTACSGSHLLPGLTPTAVLLGGGWVGGQRSQSPTGMSPAPRTAPPLLLALLFLARDFPPPPI